VLEQRNVIEDITAMYMQFYSASSVTSFFVCVSEAMFQLFASVYGKKIWILFEKVLKMSN